MNQNLLSRLMIAGVVAVIAAGAAACGRMADLDAPAPRETERAMRDKYAPDLPDPATINRPSSQMPIDGGPANPFGGTAAGAVPQ